MPPVSFVLVLHGHMPAVIGHGVWPHGADWLHEAAAETYLPFVAAARSLDSEGVPWRATVGLTPVLCEQLRDPRFPRSFRRYVTHRLRAAKRDAREFARNGHEAEPLARAWRAHYEEGLALFDAWGGDLVAPFARMAEEGRIEAIASAATHGFLPLLPSDEAAERQVDVGLAAHRRHFGRAAHGFWLPECATATAGMLVTPGYGRRVARRSIPSLLASRGLAFTFVDTHLVAGSKARTGGGGSAGGRWPAAGEGPAARSPYRVHRARTDAGSLAVLARDPRSSEQVWSGEVGYPGDPAYLEFHRKEARGGLRYWSVTDARGPLDDKELYEPGETRARVAAHAAHFCDLLEETARTEREARVVVAMFDFELFGHWWFEGIAFLAAVFRELARRDGPVRAATAAEAVREAGDETPEIEPGAGSWGRGGDFRVWDDAETKPYWRSVEDAEAQLRRIGGLDPGLLPAALRQALLLQASDWPFLVEAGTARDYALRRIEGHAGALRALADLAGRRKGRADALLLARLAASDRVFRPELGG
ncbi:MAG: 1,4-alpha-glucan branching protein domain-containing protein [Thermoanaerobaculia bacterium]